MKSWFAALAAALILAGCATVPFRETAAVTMDAVDPQQLLERYRQELPERFQLLSSVVFNYRWRTIAGIGLLEVDRPARTFHLVCFNPLGVKLFELSGAGQKTETHFVMPPLMEQGGDFAGTVGDDIRSIYFDLAPTAEATVFRQQHAIVFRQPVTSGAVEFVFAGPGEDLVEKRCYDANDDLIWRVSYYEYRKENGRRYPQGIILTNYRHGYRLTVRPKESAS